MAQLGLTADLHGDKVMALRPSGRVQNLAIGAASVQSTVFLAVSQDTTYGDALTLARTPTGTTHIRVVATSDCWIVIAPGAVATSTTGIFMPASSVEYFPVSTLDQVAVIQNAAAGTLNISECT